MHYKMGALPIYIHFSWGRSGNEVEKRLASPKPARALSSGGGGTLQGLLLAAICLGLEAGGTARPEREL